MLRREVAPPAPTREEAAAPLREGERRQSRPPAGAPEQREQRSGGSQPDASPCTVFEVEASADSTIPKVVQRLHLGGDNTFGNINVNARDPALRLEHGRRCRSE
jgi:hypothetical protein